MSEQDTPAGIPETITYQPLPNIYRAFAAGATPYAIITETIDNSIDYVRRQALDGVRPPEALEVEIRYEEVKDSSGEEEGRLIILDNAGGVPPDELKRFFQLGHTDAPPEGIGRFGVGAKRLIGIGNRIKYESHARGYGVAAGFEVDARELESEGNDENENAYQSKPYLVDDLQEGHSRIVVEDLEPNVWETLTEREEDGEEDDDKGSEDSLWRLGETYENFLRNGIDVNSTDSWQENSIPFNLKWSGPEHKEKVSKPDAIELSYPPFDGLHPRRYKGMPFANDEDTPLSECLRVDIEVGLMPSSQPDEAGLTVTMNNRNVLFRDTDNELFSSRYLGTFRSAVGHGRLHCRVSIRGDAEDMPWSDTKDGLDGTEEVTSHILNVAENALGEYRRQTYENLPDWLLAAYSRDDLEDYPSIDIDTEIKTIDKRNSKVNSPRFNDKPGESERSKYYRLYPERDRLVRLVSLHSALRIRCDEVAQPKEIPAYEEYFDEKYRYQIDDGSEASPIVCRLDRSDAPELENLEVPIGEDEEEIPVIRELIQLAEKHAEEKIRITADTSEFEQWKLPRYTEELKKAAGSGSISEFETLEEYRRQDWFEIEEPSEEPSETVVEEENESSDSTVEKESEETVTTESVDDTTETSQTDTQSKTSKRQESTQNQKQKSSGSGKSLVEYSSSTSSDTTADDSSTVDAHQSVKDTQVKTGDTTAPSTTKSGPEAPFFAYSDDAYELSDHEVEELLAALDLDESAGPEAIISAVLTTLDELEDIRDERDELRQQLEELDQYIDVEKLVGKSV